MPEIFLVNKSVRSKGLKPSPKGRLGQAILDCYDQSVFEIVPYKGTVTLIFSDFDELIKILGKSLNDNKIHWEVRDNEFYLWNSQTPLNIVKSSEGNALVFPKWTELEKDPVYVSPRLSRAKNDIYRIKGRIIEIDENSRSTLSCFEFLIDNHETFKIDKALNSALSKSLGEYAVFLRDERNVTHLGVPDDGRIGLKTGFVEDPEEFLPFLMKHLPKKYTCVFQNQGDGDYAFNIVLTREGKVCTSTLFYDHEFQGMILETKELPSKMEELLPNGKVLKINELTQTKSKYVTGELWRGLFLTVGKEFNKPGKNLESKALNAIGGSLGAAIIVGVSTPIALGYDFYRIVKGETES